MANKIGILAKKATGGGGDVTPNAVNWSNLSYNCILGLFPATEKQITGINTTITLKANYSSQYLYAGVFSSQQGVEGTELFDPYSAGLNDLATGGTITVSNNQWVVFAGSAFENAAATITITNESDGGVTLDTFTIDGVACE